MWGNEVQKVNVWQSARSERGVIQEARTKVEAARNPHIGDESLLSGSTVEIHGDSLAGEVSTCADDLLHAILRGRSSLGQSLNRGFGPLMVLAF